MRLREIETHLLTAPAGDKGASELTTVLATFLKANKDATLISMQYAATEDEQSVFVVYVP